MQSDAPDHATSSLGFLHRPSQPGGDGIILTHGAGGNAKSSVLPALAQAFADAGFFASRYNLPFRQQRAFGPPRPSEAARDRAGLKEAASAMRNLVPGRVFLGGQSYGGRQASMLCAEDRAVADGLLLLSYPLHAPGKPDQLRTQHLPQLRIPVLCVQGTNDPFGSITEMEAAVKLVPGKTKLLPVEGVGHDLGFKGKSHGEGLPQLILAEFQKLIRANP